VWNDRVNTYWVEPKVVCEDFTFLGMKNIMFSTGLNVIFMHDNKIVD